MCDAHEARLDLQLELNRGIDASFCVMQRLSILCIIALFAATPWKASPYQVLLAMNPANSSLQTQMKLNLVTTSTSTDTVPLSGFMLLDLDTNSTPARVSLRHFDMHALRSVRFTNTVLFLSKLYTSINNLQVFDGRPGPQEPYFALENGIFTLTTNILFRVKGDVAYTGVASGTMTLSPSSVQNLSGGSGTWETLNGTNRAHVDFTFALPQILITNDLGIATVNITGTGSLTALAPVGAPPPPAPPLTGSEASGRFVIRWPSSLWPTPVATNTSAGCWLYRSADPGTSSGWEREPALSSDDGTWSTVDVPIDAARRFYRLEWR